MNEAILNFLLPVMASPWIYVALFAIAAIDGFFPAVPSETLVITAGVFAAGGTTNLPAVVLVAALGAVLGDHIAYLIGRTAGAPLLNRMRPGTRRRAAYEWAGRAIAERGGLVLVVARYIPGGRTAVTITAGALSFPLRKFTFFDVIAGASWGLYSGLIGYLGGVAFEKEPIKGLLLGLGLAITVTAIVEVVRYLRNKGRNGSAAEQHTERIETGRR